MATCVGFLDPVTGRLSDIRYGDPVGPNEVLVLVMPTGDGPFTYDAVNHLAVNARRSPRTIQDITADIFNTSKLSNPAQRNAVVLDLFGTNALSVPPATWAASKIRATQGVYTTAIFAISVSRLDASGNVVFVAQFQQLDLAAAYCIDNPNYLVHPAFDTSINIPGDQPAS